jgi:hypothetical protein
LIAQSSGSDGAEPSLLVPQLPARGGGNGGSGFPGDSNAVTGGAGGAINGGGGGGGGARYIRSNLALGIAAVSPSPQIVP